MRGKPQCSHNRDLMGHLDDVGAIVGAGRRRRGRALKSSLDLTGAAFRPYPGKVTAGHTGPPGE
jgi:hypothetical protein